MISHRNPLFFQAQFNPTFSFLIVLFSTQRVGSSHRNLLWPDDDCSERYAAECDVVEYDVACPDRSLVQQRKLELEELCFELRTGIGGIVRATDRQGRFFSGYGWL